MTQAEAFLSGFCQHFPVVPAEDPSGHTFLRGGPVCGLPATRAFGSLTEPGCGHVYRCASCPLPNMSDPALGEWRELTLDEASMLEVMSA